MKKKNAFKKGLLSVPVAAALFIGASSCWAAYNAPDAVRDSLPHETMNYSFQKTAVHVNNRAVDSVSRHLIQSRGFAESGKERGEKVGSKGVWFDYLGNQETLKDQSPVLGYKATVNGLTLGIDTAWNDRVTVGFAFTAADTEIDTHLIKSGSTGNSCLATLYLGWMKNDYFVDATLSGGRTKNEAKRIVGGVRSKADLDGDIAGMSLVAGYNYEVNHWLVQPRVEYRAVRVNLDDSKDMDAAIKRVIFSSYETSELGAGFSLLGQFAAGEGVLEPEFSITGYHDLNDDRGDTILFGADVLDLKGLKKERNRTVAGLGADYKIKNGLSFGLHYGHEWLGDYTSDILNARIRYDF